MKNNKKKDIILLGATGSIGYSTLRLLRQHKHIFNQSAHIGVLRVYVSKGDRRGNDSPEERGEEEERRKS